MSAKIRNVLLVLALASGSAYFLAPGLFGNGEEAQLTLYGNVDIREVHLGFRVGGRLADMHFEEGDTIRAGDLLASLDATPQQQTLAVAVAQVQQAEAQMDRFNTGSRPQEIQQAQAGVEEAEAALANAQQELTRQEELFEKGLNSKRTLDSAIASHDQSKARLDATREALALAVEGFRKEDIAAAQASLAAARAQRDVAATAVEDARLYAPSNGIILTRVLEPGAMLAVGAPVYTLSLTDTLYVRAYVSEPNLGRVVPGMQVQLSTDSTVKTFTGQIGFVSPRAEFTPKTVETPELRTDLVYRLRIVVSNPDESLRQGMPVTVRLPD